MGIIWLIQIKNCKVSKFIKKCLLLMLFFSSNLKIKKLFTLKNMIIKIKKENITE